MACVKRYRANVSDVLNKINNSLDSDYDASDDTFDVLLKSKDLIEKMADEIDFANNARQ